eukprot:5491085-Prymnesium_polylepis.1
MSDTDTVWPSGFSSPSSQHSGRTACDRSYARCQCESTTTSPGASCFKVSSNGRTKLIQSTTCGHTVPLRRHRMRT